jgi:chemotaxis protein MotA
VDFGTLIGLVAGLTLVTIAILLGESATAFWNVPSLFIVLGGTLAATLIKFPLPALVGTLEVVRQAFQRPTQKPEELVALLVRMAQEVRRDSLLALERMPVSDPFLKRGVALAADGAEPALIESFLRTEAIAEQERHDRGQRIFRSMGNTAPAFGMIGTLIGLVQMLTEMDDPSKIGGAMAVAILTTFYGAALAYLVFIPIAEKLGERSRADWLHREMAIQGLLSILNGHHPRLVERRLHGILGPGRMTNGRLPRNRLRPAA